MKKASYHNWFPAVVVLMLPVLVIIQATVSDPLSYGLYQGCPGINLIAFNFVHGGWFHLALNWWCLINIVMLYDTRWQDVVICLWIASLYPFVDSRVILGLSGFIYAYVGMIVIHSQSSTRFQNWFLILVFILATGLLPRIGLGIHLWSFSIGSVYGLIKNVCCTRDK